MFVYEESFEREKKYSPFFLGKENVGLQWHNAAKSPATSCNQNNNSGSPELEMPSLSTLT